MSWSLLVRGTGGDTRLQRACDDSSRGQRSAVQGAVLRKGGRAASRDGVGQAGRQSWADKDQEIGPCERVGQASARAEIGEQLVFNFGRAGGFGVVEQKGQRSAGGQAWEEPGVWDDNLRAGVGNWRESWTTRAPHSVFPCTSKPFVPVHFDTAWAGQRGASRVTLVAAVGNVLAEAAHR